MAAISTLSGIENARSVSEIQRGITSISRAAVMDAYNEGLRLSGSGSTIRGTKTTGDFIERGAMAIHAGWGAIQSEPVQSSVPSIVPQGQVAWLYNTNGDGSQLYPGPVTRYESGDKVPESALAVTRAVKAVTATSWSGQEIVTGAHQFAIGDDVFATEGPLINELIPEWRRVIGANLGRVILDVPLKRTYQQLSLCGGPAPRRMVFSGITFAGDMGPLFLAQSVDIVFQDCVFPRNSYSDGHAGWVTIVGCGRITFERCKIECGLSVSSSHDITFRDCWIRRLIGEQAATDLLFERCHVGWLDSRIRSDGWTLRDGVVYDWLPVYSGWTVQNMRTLGPTVIRGSNVLIQGLRCPSAPYVEAEYEGHPPRVGENCVISGVLLG